MTADGGPSAAIARLHDPAGAVLGAGFLVTSELVVTCAHVLSPGGGPPPDGPVRVDFPLAGATASAVVTGWTPIDDGDIAVLRLTAGVPGVRPARLTDARPRWGDPVRVFGFPADLPDLGVWAAAELRDRQAAGWLQVESTTPGRVIEPGFSGAPVWSPAVPGVIGMVVAADRGAGYDTGYLVPAPALVAAHPELGAPDPAEESPFRGLEPFRPEHAAQFRGRAVLTADVVALSGRQPLILLTGPSGGGKSSLLLAGVVPAVRRAGRAVAITRTLPDTSPSTLLAGLVLPVLDAAAEVDRLEATTRLAARLDAEPGDTVRWLAGRLTDRAPGGVLLVVDQLEEAGPATARTLIGLLHDLTDAAGRRAGGEPRVVAVATLRSGLVDDVVTEVTRRAVRAGWVPVPPMTADQLQAAATPDGVTFEPGLVRRLIDDAGDEPGRLPLLEFTLDRLWSLRQVGTLTHDAYDRIGGLSGAVAGYAGQVVDSLPAADRARARRLLTRLTRPGTGGDFERHPVRLADLEDELRPVLARLAASRLVVLGRTAAGDDIAELAHQALVRRWPLLRGWLAEDRDFRLWQEDLRRSRAAWEATDRDPGGLPRGAALTTARGWATDRAADLTDADRAYLRAAEAHERRRVRRLWSAIAVVSALALLAGSLAVVAGVRNNLAQQRLRTAESRNLADDSMRFRGIDPPRAIELAQAAWRQDDTPEAWGALFAQYAGLEPVDKVFRALGRGQIQRITTSRDGDIAVLQLGRGAAAVWAGLAGDHPRRIHLRDPAGDNVGGTAVLSPSGRYVAYANALGGVAVWDLARPDAPIRLARDHLADGAVAQVVTSIAFSADDRRLLVLRQSYARDRAALTAWEIAGARPVRLAPGMAAARPQADAAYFGPDPDQIVLSDWDGVAVYRAGTGRVLRSYPAPRPGGADRIAGHGSLLLSCRDNTLRVLDIVDGRERHSVTVPTCSSSGLVVDSNTGYAVAAESLRPGASNAYLSLVDTGTGRGYRLAAPPVDVTATFDLRSPARTLALARGADGRPLALLADRNGLLYRIRGTTPVALSPAGFAQPATGRGRIASPDGAYTAAILASGRIELFDNRTNRLLTGIDAPPPPSPGFTFAGVWFGFTPDSARLLVVHRDRLVVYAVPGLTAQRSIDLPVPDLGPPPEADGVSDTWASSVLPGLGAAERDDVLILHAGVLTRWNVATGQQTGATVPLRTGTVGERRRAATLAFAPARRPGHPDQVAVVMPGDEIQIFSLSLGRAIATVPWAPRRTSGAVVFSTSGDLFASTGAEGVTTVWRTDDAAAGGRAVPTVAGDVLLGFTPDDNLVTLTTGGAAPEAKLWSADRGKQLMTLTAPADGSGWQLRGDTLTNRAEGLTRTLELDPGRWFERLCALYDTAPCRDDS